MNTLKELIIELDDNPIKIIKFPEDKIFTELEWAVFKIMMRRSIPAIQYTKEVHEIIENTETWLKANKRIVRGCKP